MWNGWGWGGGWWLGWWWLWIVIFFFIWAIFLPPFSWRTRWTAPHRTGSYPKVQRSPLDAQWESAESRFIESPSEGVAEADRVVARLVTQGGPGLEDYQAAHEVALRAQHGEGNDRDLRAAMRTFRMLHARFSQV